MEERDGPREWKLTAEEEETEARLEDEFCQEARKDFTHCLLGCFVGNTRVDAEEMIAFFKRIWIGGEKIQFFEVSFNKFIIKFPTKNSLDRINSGGPWSFAGQILFLNNWEVGLDIDDVVFEKMEVWVQVMNLPIHLIKEDSGKKIVSAFAEVVKSDPGIYQDGPSPYIRVRARIDCHKPLRRGIFTWIEGGREWIELRYERIPKVCCWCGMFSHLSGECSKRGEMLAANEKPGYGDWLLYYPLPKKKEHGTRAGGKGQGTQSRENINTKEKEKGQEKNQGTVSEEKGLASGRTEEQDEQPIAMEETVADPTSHDGVASGKGEQPPPPPPVQTTPPQPLPTQGASVAASIQNMEQLAKGGLSIGGKALPEIKTTIGFDWKAAARQAKKDNKVPGSPKRKVGDNFSPPRNDDISSRGGNKARAIELEKNLIGAVSKNRDDESSSTNKVATTAVSAGQHCRAQ